MASCGRLAGKDPRRTSMYACGLFRLRRLEFIYHLAASVLRGSSGTGRRFLIASLSIAGFSFAAYHSTMSSSFSVSRWAALVALAVVGAGCAVQPRVAHRRRQLRPRSRSRRLRPRPRSRSRSSPWWAISVSVPARPSRSSVEMRFRPRPGRDRAPVRRPCGRQECTVEIVYPDAGVTRLDPGRGRPARGARRVGRRIVRRGPARVACGPGLDAVRARLRERGGILRRGEWGRGHGAWHGFRRGPRSRRLGGYQVADHAVEVSFQADDEKEVGRGQGQECVARFWGGERIRLSAGQALKIPAGRAAGFLAKGGRFLVRELTRPNAGSRVSSSLRASCLRRSRVVRSDQCACRPRRACLHPSSSASSSFAIGRRFAKKFPDFQAPTTAPGLQIESGAGLMVQ